MLLTERETVRTLDLTGRRSLTRRPVPIDGRNVLNPKESRGFRYVSLGR